MKDICLTSIDAYSGINVKKCPLNREQNANVQLEDPVGFEPTVGELQSRAFPLGYGSK